MSTGKTQRYRNIIRSDNPPPIAVQGVACSIVRGGMVAAHLFSEYAEMPKDVDLPVRAPGMPVKAQSKRVVREFAAIVMMTPQTAVSIAEGLADSARQALAQQQEQVAPPSETGEPS